MKTSSLGIALLASVALGCSDSGTTTGPGPATPADLVGQWVANAYTVTSVANTSQSANLFDMNFTLTLTFTETSYVGVALFPGDPPENFSGTYTIEGQQLTLNETGQATPELMTYSLSGTILTLSGDDSHDFSSGMGNPQEEPVTFVTLLSKQ